eukprot:3938776-Rhodomonas_salina.5
MQHRKRVERITPAAMAAFSLRGSSSFLGTGVLTSVSHVHSGTCHVRKPLSTLLLPSRYTKCLLHRLCLPVTVVCRVRLLSCLALRLLLRITPLHRSWAGVRSQPEKESKLTGIIANLPDPWKSQEAAAEEHAAGQLPATSAEA